MLNRSKAHNRPSDRARNPFAVAALTAAILILNGCATPGDVAPQSQLLNVSQQADTESSDNSASAAVSAQWWYAFGDEQLNQLIATAEQSSPTLREAAARIRQARAAAGELYSKDKVHLGANASMNGKGWPNDEYYGGPYPGKRTWDNSAELSLSYELDFFGRAEDRHHRAAADIAYSQASAQAAKLNLSANIVRAYIQLALSYDLRDVQKARLQQQHEIVRLTQHQYNAGLGTRYDLQQAQAQLPVTRRMIRALDEQIALSKNQLVTLAAQPLSEAANIVRPHLQLASTLQLPEQLPLNLIGQRPDLVASRWMIASEASQVDLARADFYPNVNLLASVGQIMTAGSVGNWLHADNRTYSVGPALSLPILDGGARRSRLGIAAASYDEVVEQYNSTLLNAVRQVSDQLIRQQSAQEQAELADLAVTEANRVYHTAEDAFQRGLSDYLHVLDAQTRLLDQRIARQNIHAQLLTAQADLAVALGGGIEFNQIAPTEALKPERVDVKTATEQP